MTVLLRVSDSSVVMAIRQAREPRRQECPNQSHSNVQTAEATTRRFSKFLEQEGRSE
jgi:hypothetical protein